VRWLEHEGGGVSFIKIILQAVSRWDQGGTYGIACVGRRTIHAMVSAGFSPYTLLSGFVRKFVSGSSGQAGRGRPQGYNVYENSIF
jgi:hypothetical protein